jgi:hypothetical protein
VTGGGQGGAIYDTGSQSVLANCTFSGNFGTGLGTTLFRQNNGIMNLQNSIVMGNGIDCSGPISTGNHNLSTTGGCGQLATFPQLNMGALADNGGPTQTILPGRDSVALDAISVGTNGCGVTVLNDQRGITRPQHGVCDLGAVEVPYRVPPQVVSE